MKKGDNVENSIEIMENRLKEAAEASGRAYYRCETSEEAVRLLENSDLNPGDIISFIEEIDGEPTVVYGSVSKMPESNEPVHHIVIVSGSSQVKNAIDTLLDHPKDWDMSSLESSAFRPPVIEDLAEPKYFEDNRKWYDRYDRKGRKKIRKYT